MKRFLITLVEIVVVLHFIVIVMVEGRLDIWSILLRVRYTGVLGLQVIGLVRLLVRLLSVMGLQA